MEIERLSEHASNYGLNVRLVKENDAHKILELRTNLQLSKHLHRTEANIEKQKLYLRDYKNREEKGIEYYFAFLIIGNSEPIGFYRIHNIDFKNKSFSIGSWIFQQEIPENLAIFGDIISKEFGFEFLNLETCYFDVRRNNKKVLDYHKLFSPTFIREDEEENNYFYLRKKDFEENKNSIIKLLI
jgi:hypothetical protein